jgi:hypothetical protein
MARRPETIEEDIGNDENTSALTTGMFSFLVAAPSRDHR